MGKGAGGPLTRPGRMRAIKQPTLQITQSPLPLSLLLTSLAKNVDVEGERIRKKQTKKNSHIKEDRKKRKTEAYGGGKERMMKRRDERAKEKGDTRASLPNAELYGSHTQQKTGTAPVPNMPRGGKIT